MKKLIATIAFAALLVGRSSYAADTDWTWTDTALQLVVSGLLEVDREQTQFIARHPYFVDNSIQITHTIGDTTYVTPKYANGYSEDNRIIGPNASPDRINTYFASYAVGHALISYALRKTGWGIFGVPAVTIWQATVIGVESSTVAENYRIGIKMKF